ncbi:hypothetical protein ACQE3D_10685 [Methylomonas sp. MS20]|uniref:hypothetical protein n=1 Tax=unclassified Methylomonas TaxID=2608980 RepID=UPI0028A486A9|nr:hypothetical protein [Methylomonas sp. MV1]MDT4328537.1 hypothetical protein [Methylomonas sp. MV1]
MPKLYARVNLRTDIEKRDRAGLRFTRNWLELDGIDDATLAALQEDPYLEVSDSPTVLVEVAATTQTGAIETIQDPNNPPESEAQQDSADAAQGDSEQAGTASAAGGEEQLADRGPEVDASEGLATGDASTTLSTSAVEGTDVDAGDASTALSTGAEQIDADKRRIDIALAIGLLDPANPEHWLKDGRPNLTAISTISGLTVTADERDAVWSGIQSAGSAG